MGSGEKALLDQGLVRSARLSTALHFAAEKLVPEEIEAVLAEMFREVPRERLRSDVDRFVRLFLGSIYKWVQSPISLHIGNLDLDRERALQLPVVQSRAWTDGACQPVTAASDGRAST